MSEFLAWLEASRLGHLMRDSGVWTYAFVNLAHILGLSTLFGAALVLDLRLLGCWRRISWEAIAEPAERVASLGLGLALVTGVALLATKATEYAGNAFLWWIKFPAIALGLVNVWLWKRLVAPSEARMKWFGATSLLCWLIAVAAGRMTAYW